MITILAPSKTMDFTGDHVPVEASRPSFEEEAKEIVNALRSYDRPALSDLMDISAQLADLTYERILNFTEGSGNTSGRPAIFAYTGDVFANMDIARYNATHLEFAQNHLRILSGLYGILRPLDEIRPYRLEMQTKLAVGKARDLYKFWGEKLSTALLEELKEESSPYIVNLASKEYLRALPGKEIQKQMLDIDFKEFRDGQYKTIAIYAKKARGMMADFIIKNKIDRPEDLKAFDREQYHYNEPLSEDQKLVFTR